MCFSSRVFQPFPGPIYGVAITVNWYAMFDATRLYA